MYDKELIERFCNLTCSQEDMCRNQTAIVYDSEFPFKKYYNLDTIIGAINKYISKEWDDKTFAHWCCVYGWILHGGFRDDLQEELNFFENYLMEVITWDLDGLSFFDEEYYTLDDDSNPYKWIEQFSYLDHVWQTRNDWQAFYAMVGPLAESNDDQYVLLINNKLEEYMIMYSDWLENGVENEMFKYTSQEEFEELIEQLKDKYKILSRSEKFYYDCLKD